MPQPSTPPPPGLISEQDVEQEIQRLFLAQAGSGLVIRVYGEEGGTAENIEAFREMLTSLRMYDYGSAAGDVLVDAPNRQILTRALSVLAREQHQKRILDHVLTTFGRHLIDPLALILDTTPEGTIISRLSMLRDVFLAQIVELKLTQESQSMLSEDLKRLLTDDYLAMVAEHEERVQRPRVRRLAQQILRLVGSTFHKALRGWPEHAERIASMVSRRMQGKVELREVPTLIRDQICHAIEEFLWVETANEIEGALGSLFSESHGVMNEPPRELDRSLYREFAHACWDIIAEYC
ncbi:hypothetical protein [Polyangium spumosum]|uniref:Uncharacterized protein n=1 Tax=Polyangium spumosum TaxID=889282 RepID=A0A6N7PFF5_9BACT|nr:hypothetical protein [Polyangium spumosum]MRG90547.1 hypothetical protein [Polyangium spumosum]